MSMFEAVPPTPTAPPLTLTNSLEMKKLLTECTAAEAFDFLMADEQYHGFELPVYFNFNPVLRFVRDTVGDKSYEECLGGQRPDNLDAVNLEFLLNKDGRYGVRPLTLTNPYLYYFLVRELCSESRWERIQQCFSCFNVPHIASCALPIIPMEKEKFHSSTAILNWWHTVEQRSLELSLEYRYMFVTDITNCYGSINPQSFEWALNCRDTRFQHEENTALANSIQMYLKAMQRGCNIGIPQGSTLFDFVSEMVLGYADLLLHEALERRGIQDYEVIRFRDDYRIFSNSKETLENISYVLQSVLESLNFRMNSQKTKISDSIVTDAVKPDKLWYLYNTPIFNKKECDFDSFQKHLLYILMFARDYPNSGQIKSMLNDLDKRLTKRLKAWEKSDQRAKEYKEKAQIVPLDLDDINEAVDTLLDAQEQIKKEPNFLKGLKVYGVAGPRERLLDIAAIVAVATQIAVENVQSSHYIIRLISRLVNTMKDLGKKEQLIDHVYRRLIKQPNSDYLQLWLQNLTYCLDAQRQRSPYTMRLCKMVAGDHSVTLWNNSWLKPSLTTGFPADKVVNQEELQKNTPIVTFRELINYDEL